jgi:serine/threonine protein kinase
LTKTAREVSVPETLRQLISRGPVDPSTALNILGELLNALEFAHWRGVIYGDIAPENIVLTSTGQGILAEFGIAHAGDEPALTQAGAAMGTPGYMAPEQISGDPADARTDIFAMGVVAYEVLTGKHPFGASESVSASSVTRNVLYQPPLEIPQVTLAGLPRHIPAALSIALAKDPKGRFPDAISFLDALKVTTVAADVVVSGNPSLPGDDSPRIYRSQRRWKTYSLVGGLAVVALAVFLAAALSGDSGPGCSATATSEVTTSTGQSVPAVAPPTTTTTAAPTTTIPPTTTTIAPTTTTTTTTINTTTTAATPTRSEQTEPQLVYAGDWTTTADGSASGGSFLFANSSGASVTLAFEGTYLAWIAKKSPVYGKAKVTLDNQAPVIVDLYGATTLWQGKAWETGTLPFGAHTLTIEWTGTKNAAATETNVSVDAFDVAGSLTQVP